jgi:hypothetical protein
MTFGPHPGALRGAGTVINIGGAIDFHILGDVAAVRSDWHAVGQDLWGGLCEAHREAAMPDPGQGVLFDPHEVSKR